MTFTHKFARKTKLMIASAVLAVGLAAAATVGFSQTAFAAACNDVNIVRCGIEGSSLNGNIASFKKIYNSNSDNGHKDLQAVYNWSGMGDANVANMDSSNTKLGTIYRNGDIKVDGKTVATDAWVTARFTEGSGFTKVKDGVWARKTTTSFANSSEKVLVHFKGDGTFDSAVIIDCGNGVKATAVKVEKPTPKPTPTPTPTPKAALACTRLTAVAATTTNSNAGRYFKFTATATADNTTIRSYTFDYGDGKTSTVMTSSSTTEVTHTYAESGKSYTASVSVSSSDISNVTAATCRVTVTTAVAECKPGIPVGDARCQDTPTTVTPVATPPAPAPAPAPSQELVAAGPGAVITLFAGTSLLGALGHRFIRSRMNRD